MSRRASFHSSKMHRSQPDRRQGDSQRVPRWSLGVLNPKDTVDVPGSVLLLTDLSSQQTTGSPLKDSEQASPTFPPRETGEDNEVSNNKKTTSDGTIILDPQPDESPHDPLNWPKWRRDTALIALGFYCMVGGGITPLLAAGFTDVADDYKVQVSRVALTTGLMMLGLGIGCVLVSPTAIIYGKRPVYLTSAILLLATSIWCAVSQSFTSLLIARVVQGIAVSPVEALPSATITELFFLHERAFRIGIYTLMLLGGKNLVPLVSATITHHFGWRWVFWAVAVVVGACGLVLFVFAPETFWDRTPCGVSTSSEATDFASHGGSCQGKGTASTDEEQANPTDAGSQANSNNLSAASTYRPENNVDRPSYETVGMVETLDERIISPTSPTLSSSATPGNQDLERRIMEHQAMPPRQNPYMNRMLAQPHAAFSRHLLPWHGRLREEECWFRVAARPFFLFSYPAILWSAVVYSCCIGWLVVISESMAVIYRNPNTYRFSAFSTGLVYISPFIGGVLGTAVAGKMSDVVVRAMARRNGGVYEPEFRLVMIIPVAITTVVGLTGFGWSAEAHDAWIVPTVFFGVISFGCSLGSATAITFCVDSYRQFAGEALVTLNFSKNIFHGLVFSLFVTEWIQTDGPKIVYIWIGVIQLIAMLFTVPLFIFGKRARHWTPKQGLHQRITSTL
ncbi:major facilitator superfamily domain-containing protein [Triangularia setosa]|uniref:Major facilitator superfamily domain-containing protein n=1 Tax=Triangularia setosa TaxID=2587417 RepID=A0AAN6W3Q9_9PEZI|nr:major facilitator superfamily domain-containing protein [Podospora setosa]